MNQINHPIRRIFSLVLAMIMCLCLLPGANRALAFADDLDTTALPADDVDSESPVSIEELLSESLPETHTESEAQDSVLFTESEGDEVPADVDSEPATESEPETSVPPSDDVRVDPANDDSERQSSADEEPPPTEAGLEEPTLPTDEDGDEPSNESAEQDYEDRDAKLSYFRIYNSEDEKPGYVDLYSGDELVASIQGAELSEGYLGLTRIVVHAPENKLEIRITPTMNCYYGHYPSSEAIFMGPECSIEIPSGFVYEISFAEASRSRPLMAAARGINPAIPDNLKVGDQITCKNWTISYCVCWTAYGPYSGITYYNALYEVYFDNVNIGGEPIIAKLYMNASDYPYQEIINYDSVNSSQGYCARPGAGAPAAGTPGDAVLTITGIGTKAINGVNKRVAYFDYLWRPTAGDSFWTYQYIGGHGYFPLPEDPQFPLSLQKTSGNTGMTDSNNCYSLAGAKYGIFSDARCTNKLGEMTTGADGKASTGDTKFKPGTYYVEELTASPGYMLDTQVHTMTLANNGSVSVNTPFTEIPASDANAVLIQKSSNGDSFVIKSSAVFTVEFFPNNNWSGTPSRVWHYKTIDGIYRLSDSAYLDNSQSNSQRWTASDGKIVFPLGTIRISEEAAPAGYLKTDTVLKAKITQDTAGGSGIWHWDTPESDAIHYKPDGLSLDNAPAPGQIDVFKKTSIGSGLPGCRFLLEFSEDNGQTWKAVFAPAKTGDVYPGTCSSPGLSEGVLTTGEDGHAVFSGLIADASTIYRITEVSAADGHTLLIEPFILGTLPLPTGETGPTREVNVTDGSTFRLPMTGGNGFSALPITMVLTALVASWVFLRRKEIDGTQLSSAVSEKSLSMISPKIFRANTKSSSISQKSFFG